MPARFVDLGLVVCLCAGCSTVGADGAAQELRAARVSIAPQIDGRGDDPAWQTAPEVVIPLTGGTGPAEVRLRAVVHDEVLHLLAVWDDSTEDREHKLWTAGADGAVVAGAEREDVLAVAFPISGEFVADMLAPVECAWDVWQWKSARTDAAGHAMDKSHVHSFADPGGKRHAAKLADGRTLHIRRPEDAGTSATRTVKSPGTVSSPVPQYVAQTPTGSAADVRARGTWAGGRWTVELARALRTGHADDADLGWAAAGVPFSVAVFDRGEDEDHSTSRVHVLRIDAEQR